MKRIHGPRRGAQAHARAGSDPRLSNLPPSFQRLVRLLEGRWDRAVTLLVAGPGFGKTTVLAQAVRAHQAAPRGIDVWVSCEAAYEDPVCFAMALLDAMSAGGRARPGLRPQHRASSRGALPGARLLKTTGRSHQA